LAPMAVRERAMNWLAQPPSAVLELWD
jgi:hypothetical protein